MHILQVHNFYQQAGGEDVVLANEEKLLSRKGHQVWQYSVHNQTIPDMPKLQVAAHTLWNGNSYKAVRQKIQKHGIDLVHAHNTFPLISPAVYYAARAEKVPVVQTLHNYRLLCPAATLFRNGAPCEDCLGKLFPWPGIVHRCYRASAPASAMTAFMLTAHKAFGTYASKVNAYIAPSKFSLEKFVAGGLPRDRLCMKPNFVLDDPGIGSGYGGYALYVGRLAQEKGLRTLLSAWSKLARPVSLKIAGDGPLRGEVETLAHSNPRVEYLGQCARSRVSELMRNAALLVFPSEWYECCPLVVLEAIACGTPVMAPDHGSLSEMIVSGQNGVLYEPANTRENTNSLSGSLERVFGHADYLNNMRYSTRQHYEKHYSAGPNYEALLAIYRRVLPATVG